MRMIYGCNDNPNEFFALIPEGYSRQREHKLNLIKRHGIEKCLNTVFLRLADASEEPADFVLMLKETGRESILILFQWDPQNETAYFFRILPVKYSPY